MTPILSVLIPTVPARREAAWKLFDKITAQAAELPFAPFGAVEILVLLDNKRRSTGLKRDALLQASRGKYVAFVDDDDDVSDNYVREIVKASATNAGVIVFNSHCFINGQPARITHEFGAENQQFNPKGFKRGAWHIHAWRGEIARMVPFPDIQNGEDWPWCHAVKSLTATSTKIPEVLYHYRYDHETTEASK